MSTQNQILRFIMKRGETVQRRGARRDASVNALSKIQGPRTSHGQHRLRRRHQRFTFKHNFATLLQQSAAFNTDLFRCHRDQTEKSEGHSANQHIVETIFDVGGTKPSERRFTFGHGRNRKLLLRASTMSLCFRPSSLRTAKRPTFSLVSRVNCIIPRRANKRNSSRYVRRRCTRTGSKYGSGAVDSHEHNTSRVSPGALAS